MFEIVAAIGKNGEIGANGNLIWHIPEDLRFFRRLTEGSCVLMGRKTFESLPNGPLKKRKNIVVTSNPKFKREGITIVTDFDNFLKENAGSDERIFVIGGQTIYEKAIDYVNTLCITNIDDVCSDADAFFPISEITKFVGFVSGGGTYNGIGYSFVQYCRK